MSAWSAAFVPTLVRRERASLAATLLAPVIALVIAIALNLGLYILMGRDPVAVVYAMLFEPFLSWASFSEVLLKAGPLLLIAQGLAIGFRAKVFNIGAEGQFILGAIFASAIPVWFPQATGQWIWPAMLLLGAIGGALWASLTAFWRVRLNANEILVSLMLSLVAAQLLNYLLLGPWKDPNGFNFPQSVMFQYDAMVPTLISGTRLNVSFLITLALSVAAWVFMQRSFIWIDGLRCRARLHYRLPGRRTSPGLRRRGARQRCPFPALRLGHTGIPGKPGGSRPCHRHPWPGPLRAFRQDL
ncbi:ABC-type uncharacterized transport system permease subunit [Rhizobium leguminosarum]